MRISDEPHETAVGGGRINQWSQRRKLDFPIDLRLPFPVEEYRGRLERVQVEMVKHGLDALLLHQPEDICYLAGFRMGGFFEYHALAVPAGGEPVLIIRGMEAPAAAETSWITNIVAYSDREEQPLRAAQRALALRHLEAGTTGLDYHSWYLTAERLHILRELLPTATLVAEPRIVEHVRLIKSAREIERMRTAARIVEAGIRAGLGAISSGASERELMCAVVTARIRAGHDGPFAGGVYSGERTQLLHSAWTDRRLRTGDLVRFELNGISAGYTAKLMRSAVLGRPSKVQRRAFDVLVEAQDDAISRMRPGVSASEIDQACRDPVLRAGLRDQYENRVGYGLGLLFYPTTGEFLREFTPGASWTLEAGMVFHMLLQARGIGISETVLVTEDGHETLTRVDRELFVQ